MCVDLLLVVFFFFKQKTAYEMRISDWSSDVCSSDLFAPRAKRASSNSLSSWAATCCAGAAWCATWWKNCTPIRCGWRTRRQPCKRRSVRHERRSAVHERHVARPSHPDAAHSDGDRKSVVSGKSVSVLLVLGVRRIIKKKTSYYYNVTYTFSN